MIPGIIEAVLAVIEQLLTALGTSSATVETIGSVISLLEKILPIVADSWPVVYTSIKNIIAALSADPSTLPDQLATLQALDKQADDAFEAAAAETDAEG